MAVRQPTLRGVPGKSTLGSYIYALQFSIDVVKVGMSVSPSKRLHTHYGYSRGLGISVVAQWISAPHLEAERNEAELIQFCRSRARGVNAREYFVGLRFEDVVEFAEGLTYIPAASAEEVPGLPNDARWRQVCAALKQRITDGTYPPGERLPSVVAVCAEFDISQMTARKVLKQLRDEGLAAMQPGIGTFVTALPQAPNS